MQLILCLIDEVLFFFVRKLKTLQLKKKKIIKLKLSLYNNIKMIKKRLIIKFDY